ncbi:hypothetical protein WISP_80119 [Willisornis vidua]|uniref:Uncharacterized protein n=1 Tax=Willisornis vidua TaxID=1566151 RepID=A0ABQ9D4S6_9PASS|nr:hypothetical protein WISP_80119 [Willisornis vidua]
MCCHSLALYEVMMGHVRAMRNGSILLSLFVLLLATMAVWLAMGHWQRWLLETSKNPESQSRGSQSSQGAPVKAPSSSTAQTTPLQHPDAPASPLDMPCYCSPSCIPCVTVAQDLQDLVMSVWAGNGMSSQLDSGTWQVLWENLEELVELGHLPCCSTSSSLPKAAIRRQASVFSISSYLPRTRFRKRHSILTRRPHHRRAFTPLKVSIPYKSLHSSQSLTPPQSLHSSETISDSCQTPGGEAPGDRSPCSLEATEGTHLSLKMHMAKKSLEIKTGVPSTVVTCCQEEPAQQEESCSHQCAPPNSWDAEAVSAGNTLCVVAQESTLSAEEDPSVAEEVGDPPSPGSSPQPGAED